MQLSWKLIPFSLHFVHTLLSGLEHKSSIKQFTTNKEVSIMTDGSKFSEKDRKTLKCHNTKC
jgi:hypothetical protein